eukprot:TRINITY_DN12186_c0_g1_i1.p2 TRINITY_DN12186_c0_g1~~TRINITY_DN12186_c0_g1_i1.p2  ORF type:complete len:101 (+),score=13.53 TRINITY_DN12186_c0_g1_i1:200-502(+)
MLFSLFTTLRVHLAAPSKSRTTQQQQQSNNSKAKARSQSSPKTAILERTWGKKGETTHGDRQCNCETHGQHRTVIKQIKKPCLLAGHNCFTHAASIHIYP